jgi:two-component system, LuxR family, response regulator FixJ
MNPVSASEAEFDVNGTPTNQVYVIDDDPELRRSLNFLLSTAGFASWPFASASDFLDNLPNLKPAPILVDVRMEPISGIELMAILSERGIKWPVIVMTGHGAIPVAVQAMKLGATEFLEKPFKFESLETSLYTATADLSSIVTAEERRFKSRRLFGSLSPRELEVMSALMNGMSNKIAAYSYSLSVRTIEMHRANALAKLECKSIAEAIHIANDAGVALGARTPNSSEVRSIKP